MDIDSLAQTLEAVAARGQRAAARIDASAGARALYSRDCWPYLTLQARAGESARFPPDAVVHATGVDDVVEVVRWCRARRVPLVPVGGGSGVAGAAVPTSGGVALDLKLLDDLDTSRATTGLAWAGAGWIGARLEHELNRRGLTLGHFPSSIGCSTLGGYLATRSAGQLSSRHGKIEDLVVGLTYVSNEGRLVETFGGGHDLTALLVGSEGTFGVIVGAWLRVEERPVHRRSRGYLSHGVAPALDGMRELLQRGHRPAVLRLYDEFDTYISGARKAGRPASAPTLVSRVRQHIGGAVDAAAARHAAIRAANALLGRSLGAPLALNAGARRIYDDCLLVVGVEEPDAELADAVAADVFGAIALPSLGPAPGEHWYAHRYNVSYKMSPLLAAGMFVDTMEVATDWDNLANLYAEVKEALGRHVFVMAHFSHAYVTGCSIYFTFAGFAADDSACLAKYRATWDAGLQAVAAAGAAVTHHHGVGIMKAGALDADHRGGGALFAPLKAAADPDGIFNPGKLWDTPTVFP
ncbi:MAG: FAD-binding oxidoreductase [Myxococcales bacterium]|nr:FAD-binding oxidoreductase [Myxococcales bacterium]MCB9531120.1 FAD-binding oxidoreductase [Myxococcales bacterium]MCB9533030.1 FAD-binding oxidoreductase [Myxococcales bacterium]